MTTRALRMTLLGSLAGVALLLLAWYVARDAPEGEAVVPAAALQPGGADEPRGDVALAGPPRQTPAGEPADAARRAVEETPVHGGAAAEPETEEAEATLLLRGRVVDRGGEPVAGALVFASHQQGFPLDYVAGEESPERAERWQATTGADGRFELRGPEPPTIRLAVCAPGYARHQADGIAVPDTEEHELEPVVLERGTVLTGRVIDPAGSGVEGARLMPVDARVTRSFWYYRSGYEERPVAVTGASGEFHVDELPSGPWKVRIVSEAHPDRQFEGYAERPGERTDGLVFRLETGAVIAGHVAGVPAAERGRLIVRASPVRDREWFGGSGRERRDAGVDETGAFVLRGLDPDLSYRLQARLDDAGAQGRRQSPTRSASVNAQAGDRGVTLAYHDEGALLFQVVDASTGAPLTEFRVEYGGRWKRPLEDSEGEALKNHPEGRVRVGDLRSTDGSAEVGIRVRAVGYETYERDDVAFAPGEELDLGVFSLAPTQVLRVLVTDAATGEPVPEASVVLRPEPEGGDPRGDVERMMEERVRQMLSPRSATTDEEGLALLTSIEGETCVLEVSHADYAPATIESLALPRDVDFEQTVRLVRGGTVRVLSLIHI